MIRRFLQAVHKYNPQARLFFAVVVGAAFVVDGVYTVILNLYMLRLGYGTELIGLVNAAGLLSFALTSLPAGILGSRFSNTRLMKLGRRHKPVGRPALAVGRGAAARLARILARIALCAGARRLFPVFCERRTLPDQRSGPQPQAQSLRAQNGALGIGGLRREPLWRNRARCHRRS